MDECQQFNSRLLSTVQMSDKGTEPKQTNAKHSFVLLTLM